MTGLGHWRRDVNSWVVGNSDVAQKKICSRCFLCCIRLRLSRFTLRYGFQSSSDSMWCTLASERSRADGLYANSPISKFHPWSIWARLALWHEKSIVLLILVNKSEKCRKVLPVVQIIGSIIAEKDSHRLRIATREIGWRRIASHKVHGIAHCQFRIRFQDFGLMGSMFTYQAWSNIFIIDLLKPVKE